MRRIFWLAFGLGAGAVAGVAATRWTRKQANRVAPASIAREARGGLLEFSKLVSESLEEGKRAMAAAEDDSRDRLDAARHGRQSRDVPRLPAD
ncbi:MAG: hypothetical protein WD556_13805 [Actinomycetota bacterium]